MTKNKIEKTEEEKRNEFLEYLKSQESEEDDDGNDLGLEFNSSYIQLFALPLSKKKYKDFRNSLTIPQDEFLKYKKKLLKNNVFSELTYSPSICDMKLKEHGLYYVDDFAQTFDMKFNEKLQQFKNLESPINSESPSELSHAIVLERFYKDVTVEKVFDGVDGFSDIDFDIQISSHRFIDNTSYYGYKPSYNFVDFEYRIPSENDYEHLSIICSDGEKLRIRCK